MKKSLFVLGLSILTTLIFAQGQDSLKQYQKQKNKDEIKTIFTDHDKGGYFALYSGISSIKDRQGIMVGMRFATILDHWFSFGLGGNILASQLTYDDILQYKPVQFEMGYAGMFFEPSIAPKFPFHVSFPILLGAGGAFYFDNSDQNLDDNNNNWVTVDNDMFLVVEPGVELEMNFTKHTRLCIGVKYRYLSDLQLLNTKEDAFNGLLYGMTLKFGKF
jgi:hypothetical protein